MEKFYLYTLSDISYAGYEQGSGNDLYPLNDLYEDAYLLPSSPRYDSWSDYLSFNFLENDVIIKLWKYLYTKYQASYIVKTKITPEQLVDPDIKAQLIRPFALKLLSAIDLSFERYNTIISIYNSHLNKLMDKVESITEGANYFTDVPLEVGTENEDKYVGSINKSKGKTSTEIMTPIERITEIENGLNSIYLKWVNELGRCWLEDANY